MTSSEMAGATILDVSTPLGAQAEQRLRAERMIWLTTVGRTGRPYPAVVWFLWDGSTVLVYSLAGARRLSNIERNPRVSLHLDGDGDGGGVVILHGRARIAPEEPPADEAPAFVEKYLDWITGQLHASPQGFARMCSVPLRVVPTRVQAHGVDPPVVDMLRPGGSAGQAT